MENHLSRKLVVFDLDRTLITANSSYCFLRILYRKRLISFSTFFRAIFLRLRFELTSMTVQQLHHRVFNRLLRGFSIEILEKNANFVVEQLVPGSLYLPAYQELIAAQKRGDYVVLMSSSADFLVEKFAAYFNIDRWEATGYGVDKENRLCKIAKLVEGSEKARCLLELQQELGIHKHEVVVFTDSDDDIPLLLKAGQAVAVNPNKKLRIAAKLHGWRVI